MIFYILNREMDVVASMSNDSREMLWIDDTSGGQTISLINGCAIGSFDFKTDPYLPDSVYVKAGNFIAFNDKYNRTRLYTIMTVEGDDELDVHCEDIGLDLINEMANAWNFETDQTLDFYLNQVFGNSSWKVVYEASGLSTQTRHLKFDNNTDTKLSRLESIMSGFGFEGDFQITMEYMSVKTMEFHVYKTLGNKTEYDISKIYIDSINLISLNRNESIDDLYTAVLPTGGQVAGKALDISSVEYDDGQFWTTKGDNKLYDRLAAQKWSRFAGTSAQDKTKDPAYIYGHYSSSTTAVGTLFDEALTNLKEHHDVKLAYEAKLLDLDSDLGDWIEIVDHAKQQDVYLKARIQEVTNHYTVSGEDEGKLANYKLLSTANGDTIRNLLNQIQEKVSKVVVSDLYFVISDQGSYAPINSEWSVNQPDIPEGKFLWIKTVDKYSDGTERVTYTVTKNKIDYHGPATVVSRVTVYFLSISQHSALKEDGTAPNKSEWTTEQPAYKDGRYFWKREIVTWSDGTIDYTFETYDQQMTEASKKANDASNKADNAQSSADKANTNASNAQNTANNAQDVANKADAKADLATSDAAAASSAAQVAKKQADAAQKASDDANRLANSAWTGVSTLEQVVKVDQNGVKVLEAANSKNYAKMQSNGLHVFTNENQVAQFGEESKMRNLAVQDYLMFGAHRAELSTINGEQVTAFYWIGDIQ